MKLPVTHKIGIDENVEDYQNQKPHRRTRKEIDEFLKKASQACILVQGRIDTELEDLSI